MGHALLPGERTVPPPRTDREGHSSPSPRLLQRIRESEGGTAGPGGFYGNDTASGRLVSLDQRIPEARDQMIVNESGGLHESVAYRRTDEAESARLQFSAHLVRFLRPTGNPSELFPSIHSLAAADEPPDVSIEAPEFLLDRQKCLSVRDRRLDLETVSYDTRIRQQLRHAWGAEACDATRIEPIEGFPVVLALAEHGQP